MSMASIEVPSTQADLPQEEYADEAPSTELTMEEMLMENRSLKESLTVCIEFKRLLEHIFDDQQVLKSGVIQKYKQHYWKNHHKYRAYRKAFGDHLVKTIESLDSPKLTKCFNKDCKLPGCNEYENDFNQMNEISDAAPHGFSSPPHELNGHEHTEHVDDSSNHSTINRRTDEDDDADQGDVEDSDHDPQRRSVLSEDQANDSGDAQADDGENGSIAANTDANVNPSVNNNSSGGPPPTKRLRPIETSAVVGVTVKGNKLTTSTSTSPSPSNTTSPATSSNNSGVPGRPQTGHQQKPNVVKVKKEIIHETEPLLESSDAGSLSDTSNSNVIHCKVADCKLTFEQPSKANEHYKSHSKLFKCSVCSLLFSSKTLVFRHFIVHNPQAAKDVPDAILKSIRNNGF